LTINKNKPDFADLPVDRADRMDRLGYPLGLRLAGRCLRSERRTEIVSLTRAQREHALRHVSARRRFLHRAAS